jgi:hypothetical protein
MILDFTMAYGSRMDVTQGVSWLWEGPYNGIWVSNGWYTRRLLLWEGNTIALGGSSAHERAAHLTSLSLPTRARSRSRCQLLQLAVAVN